MKLATDGYAPAVADYFLRPPRPLTGPCRGRAGSREAGALVEFATGLDGALLSRPAFRALGCPHIIAACNLLAERLDGRPVEALVDPALDECLQTLEIPLEKAGKLLIVKDALRALHRDCSRQLPG